MAKENTPRGKQGSGTSKQQPISQMVGGTTPSPSRKNQRSGSKGNRSAIGGTAVPGAKSTQPKQIAESSNQQQQQYESQNRDMRRRMERMGYEDENDRAQNAQNQRKKRMDRLKQRRQEQLSHVKRTLPGGKIDTSPRRVYWMIAAVAIILIAVIAIFAILRATGH
ncbi:hypothetical protein KDW_17780 [Dictyobacter vulcani]|uniref:Uncharacterized protein n=1 Tax=Dictyobacter vulcani TaxID=2607529 RepID=A0A5J4KQX9_9CHLR|nr:hypothetical protein [Dictyobacter vulcani]GER87616.1 hypothetical protein KDW_17780 [Dictyobacter vulcani]